MYTSPHSMHNLAVCNHYQQVTVFCITGASTNFATPRLDSIKELLQRYEIKITYAIPGVEKGTQSSTRSLVMRLHSRILEQIISNHLRCIKQSKILCGWRDSNSHAFRHQVLNLACLPFHHIRILQFNPGFFKLFQGER